MSAVAIVTSFIASCLGILSNCSIIVLVILTKQLNSPNRILLLHLSIVCLSLSILYLWILINNSIMPSPLDRFNTATIPESAAISTATTSSTRAHHYHFLDGFEGDGTSTHSPLSDSMHDSVCSVNDLLIHLLQPIGLWTISCINFDRYYAICSPLHYNTLFTTKKVTIFLATGWLIIVLTILPIYLMLMISDDRHVSMAVCWFRRVDMRVELARSFDKDYYWFEVQILLTTLLTIFMPISLIVACNIRVLTIANYQRHRIASAIYESVLSAQVAITHQKNPFPPLPNLFEPAFPLVALYPPKPNPFELRKKSQKAAIVVFNLIVSVVILYCPYYLFVIIFSFYRKSRQFTMQTEDIETHETVLNIVIFFVQLLILCAPTVNAGLYGFKNKTIQENIHNIWRKQKTKIELHYEIQARTPSTCGSRKASLTEVTANLPNFYQPQLKRQLSDFFFGTSSSLTSHLNDDTTPFHSNKIHRTPSDSFFSTSNGRRHSRDLHHEYLSPNFDPLGKKGLIESPATSPPSAIKMGISPSTSKNLLNNFKKLLQGSRSDMSAPCEFPQILITKHSDSLLNATSRRESDIQQVSVDEDLAEKEPLLTTQTQRSLESVHLNSKGTSCKKFQTL